MPHEKYSLVLDDAEIPFTENISYASLLPQHKTFPFKDDPRHGYVRLIYTSNRRALPLGGSQSPDQTTAGHVYANHTV